MNLKEARKVLEVLTHDLEFEDGRKYASPSFIKRTKNKMLGFAEVTGNFAAFDFGEELHRMILEPDSEQTIILSDDKLEIAKGMQASFMAECSEYLEAEKEVDVRWNKFGGRIDLLGIDFVADIKTTSASTMNAFLKSLMLYDSFIQALLYMIMTEKEHFYFLGISKKKPHKVFIVDVADYPEEMEFALDELLFYVKYLNNEQSK